MYTTRERNTRQDKPSLLVLALRCLAELIKKGLFEPKRALEPLFEVCPRFFAAAFERSRGLLCALKLRWFARFEHASRSCCGETCAAHGYCEQQEHGKDEYLGDASERKRHTDYGCAVSSVDVESSTVASPLCALSS